MNGAPPLYEPARLAAALEREGIETLVATRPANVLYLTRYRKGGSAAAVITATEPDRPALLIPASDIDFVLEDPQQELEVRAFGSFYRSRAAQVELEPREARVSGIADGADAGAASALELAAALLADRSVGSGAVAVDAPLASDAPALGGGEEVPEGVGAALLRGLRAVKTPAEQERLRRAAAIAEAALEASTEAIAEGVTEADIARAFCIPVVGAGARVRMDNVSIARGSALGNVNQPTDAIACGSVIRYDVGAIGAGYESDLSRCFSLGPAPARALHFHAALVAGQQAALDALQPGVSCGELHSVAVEAVRAAGIPHYERTNVGHGIGIHGDGYDPPLLAPGSEVEIEPGMVLCIEAPYYELGFCGLQVEDMVVVTDDGHEPLSRLPRELRELP